MIRSVLYLSPRDGDGRSVADFYRRHSVLERATEQDGCLGAELQLPLDAGGDVLVTATWRDPDAYQGWLDNPLREANAEELAALLRDPREEIRGALYEIDIEAVPGR